MPDMCEIPGMCSRQVFAFGRAERPIKGVSRFSLSERKRETQRSGKCHAAAGQSAKHVQRGNLQNTYDQPKLALRLFATLLAIAVDSYQHHREDEADAYKDMRELRC